MRDIVCLECGECKNRNYYTEKELKGPGKLQLKKFCKFCRSHTMHKERKKK